MGERRLERWRDLAKAGAITQRSSGGAKRLAAISPGRGISHPMALADEFAAAQARALELSRPPTTDEMLELYALYKQATAGDAHSKRPGMLDFKARAKYDAWAERKGMSNEAAMQSYVELVSKLAAKYG